MSKRQILISCLAFVLIMVFVVSCAPARRPGEVPPETAPRQTRFFPRLTPRRPAPGGPQEPVPGPVPAPRRAVPAPAPGVTPVPRTGAGTGAGAERNMTQRAERIARAVARQDEIESATCVITGNTAMVGVQFDEQYKGQLTNQIKERVDKIAKQQDDRVTRVAVTADPDLVTRIETIFRDIGRGRPVAGFTREMNELMNRIQPR